MAAFVQLAGVLVPTRSTARIRLIDGVINIEISTTQKDFPVLLLEQAAGELEDSTGRVVNTVIRHKKEREQLAPIAGR